MAEQHRILLFAVDDSDDSERAFRWGLDNIYKLNDEVHLCHVIPKYQLSAGYAGAMAAEYVPVFNEAEDTANIKNAEEFILKRCIQKMPGHVHTKPIVHVVKSTVDPVVIGQVLCKKAQELHATGLIIASHNRGRIAEFFLGSVTKYCVHHSKTPVIVVH